MVCERVRVRVHTLPRTPDVTLLKPPERPKRRRHPCHKPGRLWESSAGIEAALEKSGMALPRNAIHQRMETMTDEQVLRGNGATYRFAVPLYRRWIAWRWPSEKVREEVWEK